MPRSKLTDRDREQLVDLYRNSSATLQSLATQFEVSYSTASRIVKDGIPADEYRALVKAKRGGSDRQSPSRPIKKRSSEPEATQPPLFDELPAQPEPVKTAPSKTARPEISETPDIAKTEVVAEADEAIADVEDAEADFDEDADFEAEPSDEEASIAAEFMGDDRDADDDDDIDATLDDEDDLDEDEEDEADGDTLADSELVEDDTELDSDVQVRELEDIDLPQRLYAVVDRFQELSSAPLSDFKHLGSIPAELAQATTLPVFDEHRVARRFADRSKRHGRQKNRPIAFPGHYVWVTRTQLRAKGIEYLLYDGHIYAL